jgi:radical SAM superfamily enzyme YgiQ (UPF0313 family)
MKIVLTRPNYVSHIITPPLGLGYLASFLKANGVEVVLIDALRDALPLPALVERIVAQAPDAVGISCLTAYFSECAELSRLLKERGVTTIIGGVHPTFLPFQTLRDSAADFVICGEGENALLQLVKSGFRSAGIAGVYRRGELEAEPESIVRGTPVAELDALPFPDWEQMAPASYPKAPHGAIVERFPIGVVTTTRGCPYPCTFCASPGFYDRRIRFRSPENVVDEIEYLVKRFGVREIHFEDDNLTIRREHVAAICRLIIERGLKISWACPNGIRADKVDEPLIRLMKESGCYFFAFGIESANRQILDNIKKQESIETIRQAIEIADRVGISCQGFFIFGLPGETPETIEETIDFAVSSKLARAQFVILDVLPGAELWTTLAGTFTPNWDKNSYKEPEWLPPGVSREMLLAAQSRAFRRFYLRPAIFFRLLRLIRPSQLLFILQRLREFRVMK